jgi:hypothetical protein
MQSFTNDLEALIFCEKSEEVISKWGQAEDVYLFLHEHAWFGTVLYYTRVLGFVSYFQYVKTKLCAMIGVFTIQCRPLEMMKSSETLKQLVCTFNAQCTLPLQFCQIDTNCRDKLNVKWYISVDNILVSYASLASACAPMFYAFH